MSLHHMLRAAAGSAGPSDPYFEYNTLLLTGDGTNGAQNNTFLDSSSNNFTITRNGNTTQGTFSPYGNLWSNFFNSVSADYLSVPNNAALQWSTGDFCVEAWVYPTNPSASNDIVCKGTNNAGTFELGIYSSKLELYTNALVFSSSATIAKSTWTHIAVTRSGTTLRCFINGVLDTSVTSSYDFNNAGTFYIGVYGNAATNFFNGYISNLRCVKGSAVYTSSFTPSTTPLTAVSGTSLLTCQSNRFIDNSSNNFAITVNGNTSVQRFSPFNPTAPYSASTIGGSGYFDGTGDYLNTPATGQFAPAGDFTIGAWFYPLALATYNEVIGNFVGSGTSNDWIFEVNSNGSVSFYTNGATVRISAAAGSVKVGQWNYIALCRSGTTITGYVNGVSAGTYTQSGTFGSATKSINIGAQSGGYWYVNGYISDIKLIDGSAVTTVPTAPMTATTGTKLLLNFTNSGIPDAAMQNDLETVGNAQVSTSVKKYGTGSLAFDGTGDWLTMPDTVNLQLGTGNFTVECWLYLGATGAARGIVGKGTSTTGWLLSTNTSNQVVFTYGSSTITSATLSGSTWYHIAVCREGTGTNQTKIYVDGTNNGTGTVSTDFNQTNIMYVGADRAGGSAMNGYIDDLRITKGLARYTANFTPPTAALPVY